MRFFVVAAGRLKDKSLRAVVDDYFARVRRYARCDEIEVKDDRGLAKAIPEGSLVVALEVGGESLSSTELAQRIERWTSRGKGAVTFVIGGAEGIPSELSCAADARLSLSRLTLPHRLARLPAGRVAVLQFVYPASAVAVEWAVYGRALSPSQLAGVLMMLVALVVVGTQRAAARHA